MRHENGLKIKIQLYCGDEIAMGPGKADLLEAIAREGSITAAGRALGMSYSRAWNLVDVMNRCWSQPLVETSPGSRSGGGARLTDAGAKVLGQYRMMQAALYDASDTDALTQLQSALLERPLEQRKD